MSGRMFFNVIAQFRETVPLQIGVIDADGTVVACTELRKIGESWPQAVAPINEAGEGCITLEGKTFRAISGWGERFDFAVYAEGEDEMSRAVCAMAAVALGGAKSYYEEKHDKNSFIKSIISDNILLGDIYVRAKELHVDAELPRSVFVIRRRLRQAEHVTVEALQNLLPEPQNAVVLAMGENDFVLIRQVPADASSRDLEKLAEPIVEAFRTGEQESAVVIGIGTVANHLRDLAKSYKEAQISIEIGRVFDTDKCIINYENLGIGRLIYQLPTTLCEMFLQEVFKVDPIDALDRETLFTTKIFFENNLVLSETARSLFVHRNTLVYRLEKIKRLTGLDLREFDDAVTFKVALMVRKYLASRGVALR